MTPESVMKPPNPFQRDIDHWNRTGKCLRHFALDIPPQFCEQCGKRWKAVMDGREGRARRRSVMKESVRRMGADDVARENWRDAVKVLDEIETLHRPLPYSFIDEDGASWPTRVCSSCRLGVMPQAWPCSTINAMAGYARLKEPFA